MMYGYNVGGDWALGHSLFGGFFMIIVWVAVIFFVVWVVREFSGRHRGAGGEGGKTAIDVLRERYAKGEIDRKEFEEKKSDLSS